MIRFHRFAVAIAFVAAPALGQGHGGLPADRQPPPLSDDLGSHHRRVTTASPSVQAYFDQGLQLLMAADYVEAERSFHEAVARDPDCAMCWWGVAMSLSPQRTAAGARAASKAIGVLDDKPRVERQLVEAVLARLADPDPAEPDGYRALDRAYAEKMAALAAEYPDDLDIQTFYAESLLNLQRWELGQRDGSPAEGNETIVATLERVLERNPDHPGAVRLYRRALEASRFPGRGGAAGPPIPVDAP